VLSVPARQILPLFIPHAGCVHACVFCDQRRISGENKPASADDVRAVVMSAIKAFEKTCATHEGQNKTSQSIELALYGGSFTALPEAMQNELLDAAHPLLKLGAQCSIRISTRPDYIDTKTVQRLKSYGVNTIELGAQSMCDDVLSASLRGHNAADVVAACDVIKSAGLSLILQMMTGLPGDTHEKSLYTAGKIAELKPAGVRIYPSVIIRGTKLHEMWQSGEYTEHTVHDAVELCAKICIIFENANIPIIRLGLNPTDELSAGSAVAGAYHPALGELVYSKVLYNKVSNMLYGIPPGSSIEIIVGKGMTSKMAGHRRENILALKKNHSLNAIKIVESNVDFTPQIIQLRVDLQQP